MSLPAKPITPQEINYYITKLHNNKSLGYDLINNKILKKLTNKTILLLTHIYYTMHAQVIIHSPYMEILNNNINC